MRIQLNIPDGSKVFHYVILYADREKETIGTLSGEFAPKDREAYRVCISDDKNTEINGQMTMEEVKSDI